MYNIFPLSSNENIPQLSVDNFGSKVEFLFPPCLYEYYTGLPATQFDTTTKYFEPLTYEKIVNFENRCMV